MYSWDFLDYAKLLKISDLRNIVDIVPDSFLLYPHCFAYCSDQTFRPRDTIEKFKNFVLLVLMCLIY